MADEQEQEQDLTEGDPEVREESEKRPKTVPKRSDGAVPFLESLAGDLWRRNQALEEALAEGSDDEKQPDRKQANESSDSPIDQFSEEDTQAVFLVSQLAKERGTTIADLWADGLEAIEKLHKIERDTVISKLCEHHGLKRNLTSRLLDGIDIEPEPKEVQRHGRKYDTYVVRVGNESVPIEDYLQEYIDDIRASAVDVGTPVPTSPRVRAAPNPVPGRSGGEVRARDDMMRSGRYAYRF